MRIAISAESKDMDSLIDQRFGRCNYFLIIEDKRMIDAVENEGASQGHGAGTRAAQQLGELDVKKVITGDVGPKAADVLNHLNIDVYHASGSARKALEEFENGNLKIISNEAADDINSQPRDISSDAQDDLTGRVFFPLLDNNGTDSRISPHFGHAPFFGLYDIKTREFTITGNSLSHTDPNKSPVDQIIEAVDPTIVFAQGIGARAIMLFKEKGIAIRTGSYGTVKEVINNMDNLDEQISDCGHHH
ncbi:hypothetical protein K9M79_08665 [Candidatus Woesearchaeota archaeon]|nr:hypothetical protein [Candidatus Woesearchaeota archaeon]